LTVASTFTSFADSLPTYKPTRVATPGWNTGAAVGTSIDPLIRNG
jgi:hypothetical protein